MSDRPAAPEPKSDFETARAEATLTERLAARRRLLRQNNPGIADAYQALVERLVSAGSGDGAPREGDVLPPFLLPDDDGRLVSSADLLAEGPLVISFNRGSWCSFCWLELSALNDSLPAMAAKGARLLSITPEVSTYSRQLKRRLGLNFPVLTDIDNGYALELGLAIPLSQAVRDVLLGAAMDLTAFQRNAAWLVPIPATMAVRPDGRIAQSYVNPDSRERLDPLTLLEGLDRPAPASPPRAAR